jgi:quinol monooxygenase YgiN
MLIAHVHVHVKPESVDEFCRATVENARSSVQEPGITRFDVVQQQDDATRFVLIEIYRDAVAPMMAEPRSSVKYNPVFPESQG